MRMSTSRALISTMRELSIEFAARSCRRHTAKITFVPLEAVRKDCYQ